VKRKKPSLHVNHERWLVSYADFITLLFALFVVMFASAQGDKGRAARVSESVKKALENRQITSLVTDLFGGAVDARGKGNAQLSGPGGNKLSNDPLTDLMVSMRVLSEELKTEMEAGKLRVSMERRGLTVSFKEAALFASGDDAISPEANSSIQKVAAAIIRLKNPVRLEGHTDSLPIHTSRFRSNWELSAARSIALLEKLCHAYGVPEERLSVGGYGDTAPIDSNDTPEGRGKNRRCDIIILNDAGAAAEPDQRAASAAADTHTAAKPSPAAH
jgi:chemotaxis protein MotB